MRENKIYCVFCDKECTFHTKMIKKTVTVKDLTFEAELLIAYCNECGEEVFPDSIGKQNDLIVFDEYRKQKGLLTSKQIKAIREKRKMSQVQLARFIKAGDKNIARYETGTIQDPAFDYLIRLVGDDECYKAMLKMQNKKPKENRFSCLTKVIWSPNDYFVSYSTSGIMNWWSNGRKDKNGRNRTKIA